MTKDPLGEILFEFTQRGNAVQVSALHVASNTEISLMAPRSASTAALQDAALQKLRYVLAKKAGNKP